MKCQVLIDYLTFSIKNLEDPAQVIRKYLGLDPALFQEAPYGLMGYQRVLRFGDIQVLYDPRENEYFHDMGICVSMSGNGCRAFETMSKLTIDGVKDTQGTASTAFPVLFQLLAATEDANISRIDIACDDREGHLCMDDIVRKVQDNEINSRMSKRTLYLGYDGTQRSGTTVYIGAESSAFRVRIYDKALERGESGHWVQVELGMAVEDIRVDDIQRLFNGMDTSKETKYKVKRLLNQVLNAAVDDEFLMKSPLKSDRIKITGAESTTTAVYSVEQMQYLIQHIGDIKQPLDRTYMAIQALHPLRLEEVLGLKWSDIDMEHMALSVNRAVTHPTRNQPEVKDTKTRSSIRTIGLSALAVSYLTPGKADEFVLGGNSPLSYTQVRRMCERIQKDTGFTEKITPKRFRTTVLTDLYDKTRDIKLVQAAAGHTTAEMTLKHYVKGRGNVVKSSAAIESAYTA